MSAEIAGIMNLSYKKAKSYVFSKNFVVLAAVMTILGLIMWYMLWASALSQSSVLIKTIPEYSLYLAFAAILGLIAAGWSAYSAQRPIAIKPLLNTFASGCCLGFIAILNSFSVYVYLFPEKVISYVSEYEVVFPGPARGKYGHCEAGLWIKDVNTAQWIKLCTNKNALYNHRKQGMDAVWVTARINKLGSYILNYEFIYK